MNKKKFIGCLLMLLIIPFSGYCQQDTLRIATDMAYWYPFSYVKGNQPKGIHIDLVQTALFNLGYKIKFYPRPWKRCLEDVKKGEYDALVSASYRRERAEYLIYPEDAANPGESIWRLTQVEYVVMTNSRGSYTFDGDLKNLPQPVRAPLGYSIADDLRSAGIPVIETPDIMDCVTQLVNSGRGSFITPPENAKDLFLDDRFKGELKIHPKPITSKSYFMAFAKKNQKLDQKKIIAIWDEIARLRDDGEFMKTVFNKYQDQKQQPVNPSP